jgi:hypothetical protein
VSRTNAACGSSGAVINTPAATDPAPSRTVPTHPGGAMTDALLDAIVILPETHPCGTPDRTFQATAMRSRVDGNIAAL